MAMNVKEAVGRLERFLFKAQAKLDGDLGLRTGVKVRAGSLRSSMDCCFSVAGLFADFWLWREREREREREGVVGKERMRRLQQRGLASCFTKPSGRAR
jgi:hypothetical protein